LNSIKLKLGYEWKSIYRALTSADSANDGTVSKEEFEAAVSKSRTFLTREELNKLFTAYPGETEGVNY